MAGALDGVKVLDLSRVYSGPFCTLMLRELGAEVIKVEIVGAGDTIRIDAPLTKGAESGTFIILNRGKESVTLNLKSAKGREICLELAKKVDVLVENFSPGTMEKLGLGNETLCKLNPRLIYASISAYGQTGPRRNMVGYDPVIQAMGGMTGVTGFPDSPPIKCGVSVADFGGGLFTALAIVAALHHRQQTGEGQRIDIALQDCIWFFTAIEFSPPYFLTGHILPRLGNSHVAMTPGNLYMAKDGPLIINTGTLEQVHRLYRIMGREDLINTPLGANQNIRIKHKAEVDAAVGAWTKTKTVAEVLQALQPADIVCSPVPSFDQVCNDEHLIERGMITEVEQTVSGKVKVPGSVFKLSKTPGDPHPPAPVLGEHTLKIFKELLGYTEEQVNQLSIEDVI